MGLSNSVHWMAWFITSFICMFISIVLLTILLKMGGILIYSDATLILFIFSMFGFASIAMAFLISVFFSRANISAACGGIIYFFTYLPYPITVWYEEVMSFSDKSAAVSDTLFSLCPMNDKNRSSHEHLFSKVESNIVYRK